MANYAALLTKYDYDNSTKTIKFINDIPEDKRDQFRSLVNEGQLVARTVLQASLDVVDTVTRSTATAVVIHRASWLHSAGHPKELQSTVEDLPFDREKHFAAKMDKVLHTMKDSQATLSTLGIYTPATKRRQHRSQPYQRNRYNQFAQ